MVGSRAFEVRIRDGSDVVKFGGGLDVVLVVVVAEALDFDLAILIFTCNPLGETGEEEQGKLFRLYCLRSSIRECGRSYIGER